MSIPLVKAEYSIAAVSKLTGVSCHALRVWERRYGFPAPHRSPSGHRRYRHDQVQVLRRISELAQNGQSIGGLIAAHREGRLDLGPPPAPSLAPRDAEASVELMARLMEGDLAGADACFAQFAALHAPIDLVLRVIEPALVDIGERWFRRECEIFQERSISGYLLRKLSMLIDAARFGNAEPARTILVGGVQGDRHAGGVMILHLFLEQAGWRVRNLGVDLPVREYEKAIIRWRPDAIALSFVLSRNINKRFQELSKIEGLPVYVGGRSILNYQSLARRFGLFPLPGPIGTAGPQLLSEFEDWSRTRSEAGVRS